MIGEAANAGALTNNMAAANAAGKLVFLEITNASSILHATIVLNRRVKCVTARRSDVMLP